MNYNLLTFSIQVVTVAVAVASVIRSCIKSFWDGYIKGIAAQTEASRAAAAYEHHNIRVKAYEDAVLLFIQQNPNRDEDAILRVRQQFAKMHGLIEDPEQP